MDWFPPNNSNEIFHHSRQKPDWGSTSFDLLGVEYVLIPSPPKKFFNIYVEGQNIFVQLNSGFHIQQQYGTTWLKIKRPNVFH